MLANVCVMYILSNIGGLPVNYDYQKLVETMSKEASIEYGVFVDPNVINAIIIVESSGNPYAVRFEPSFLKWLRRRITLTKKTPTLETEYYLRSTSFGLGQIMGQTARELGFNGLYLTELCDPEINIKYLCKYFAKLLNRYRGEVLWAISAYNAGSAKQTSAGEFVNQHYVNKVQTQLNKHT